MRAGEARMTIERLHFPDGYPMDLNRDFKEQAVELFLKHRDQVETLPEGEYNLTPDWWTKRNYDHHLTVFGDGSGLYRLRPVYPNSFTQVGERGRVSPPKRGGHQVRLPADSNIAVVAGSTRDGKNLGMVEILVYLPGASPVKESQAQSSSD